MKKIFGIMALFVTLIAFAPLPCSAESFSPGFYTETVTPADYTIGNARRASRTGRATCHTIMYFINWGNCSINSAMRNGGITSVSYADWEKKWVVLYGAKTLRVHGN